MFDVFDESDLQVLADRIDSAASKIVEDHKNELVAEEEDYTQRVVSMLSDIINGYMLQLKHAPFRGLGGSPSGQVRLQTAQFDGRPAEHFLGRPLSRKGPRSEERQTGADMMLVFRSDGIDGLQPHKGLLAQAKKKNTNFRRTAEKSLLEQCADMAKITDENFAFIYGLNGIHVFRNAHIKGLLQANAADFTLGQMVAKFVSCEIGDNQLHEIKTSKFAAAAAELRENRLATAAELAEVNALEINAKLV